MTNLEIQGISKTFGRLRALDDVSLSIRPGVFGLLGPNGAGKTTLMRIIATLLPPNEGSIQYGSVEWNWRKNDLVKRHIGYLPQNFSFYPYLQLREALEYVAMLKKINNNLIKNEVDRVVEMTNLSDHLAKRMSHLSGGMLRRFGIAQAMIGSPSIIIVDEPTAGLDPAERVRFRNLFWHLSTESIVILSTHIVQDVEAICNQVAILNSGHIVACAEPASIANMARGYVRSGIINKHDFQQIEATHEIISFSGERDGVHVRYLDDSICDEGGIEPTLEDAYLMLMRGAI